MTSTIIQSTPDTGLEAGLYEAPREVSSTPSRASAYLDATPDTGLEAGLNPGRGATGSATTAATPGPGWVRASRPAPPPPRTSVLFEPSPPWVLQPSLIERLDALELWDHFDELRTNGFTMIPRAFDAETVDRLRDVVCAEARSSNRPMESASTWCLLDRDPVFVSVMMDPRHLALADAACGFAQLSYQAGTLRDANCNPLSLHAEQSGWMPAPYSLHQHMLVSLVALDDLDEDNGCTTFVPGSHFSRLDPPRGDEATAANAVRLHAPRGSLTCWLGGTWHGTHPRSVPGQRAALHHIYSRGGLRQLQDFRDVARSLAPDADLRARLGLTSHLGRDADRQFDDGDFRIAAGLRGVPEPGAVCLPWDARNGAGSTPETPDRGRHSHVAG